MSTDTLLIAAAVIGLVIIAALAFYAGQLLRQLSKQRKTAEQNRLARVEKITESIRVIAKATEQQQCNLSEASIRIFELLKSLPIKNPPAFTQSYPALFELYEQVKHLPTHQARKELERKEREQQDEEREEAESKLESRILKEMAVLKVFSAV